MSDLYFCRRCLAKQQRINQLDRDLEELQAILRSRKRAAAEAPFGSATPSSKVPFKPNALSERQARRGGGKWGMRGTVEALCKDQADRVESVSVGLETYPDCGVRLLAGSGRKRTVIDLKPPAVEKEFLLRAGRVRRRIIAITHRQARHPAIRKVQEMFHRHRDALYRWSRDPTIPSDNNLAERGVRPLVIARKASFSSQSEAGAHTRETLMAVLHTLKKRRLPIGVTLRAALDALAANPALDPAALPFKPPSRAPCLKPQDWRVT